MNKIICNNGRILGESNLSQIESSGADEGDWLNHFNLDNNSSGNWINSPNGIDIKQNNGIIEPIKDQQRRHNKEQYSLK